MKPTPEQIKQMAIECGFRIFQDHIQAPFSNEDITKQLHELFTRAYELGWKDRGESDATLLESTKEYKSFYMKDGKQKEIQHLMNMDTMRVIANTIRNNTGE